MSINGADIREAFKNSEKEFKQPNPFKDDVLYTPEGQWKYPGQVTKIPNRNITMKGVNYPVLGVDDLGNEQMMYPGGEYTFPGQTVTEYPIMSHGGAALNLLKKAIKIHEGHLNGKIPTSQKSQKQLMELIEESYESVSHKEEKMKMTYGGWLDEMKLGGTPSSLNKFKAKRGRTSKNIQSSINKLFLRNHTLYGYSGKNIYDPAVKFEEGGWLDQYQNAGTTGVNKYIPKLSEKELEFLQLPKWKQEAIKQQNTAMASRKSEAQLSQGKKLTEDEQAYSDKVSRRIKYPFSDFGIAAGNLASYLTRFHGLSPEEIAASTNNPMGTLAVSSEIATYALANEMAGPLLTKGFNKGSSLLGNMAKKNVTVNPKVIKEYTKTAPAINPFPEFLPETSQPFKQVQKVAKTDEEALQNIIGVDDWHNFENKYKGKNIAKSGHFNEGVFELEGHPGYVAKIESPFYKDADVVGQSYPHLNIADLHKGITSPNVGKVVYQFPHPADPMKRILITKKVEGKAFGDLTVPQLKKIPAKAFTDLEAEHRALRNQGLAVDFVGDNILYNPKEKAFKIIDLSPTPSKMADMESFWSSKVIRGVDPALPKAQSAKYIRDAIADKYANAFQRGIYKATGEPHPGQFQNTWEFMDEVRYKQPITSRANTYRNLTEEAANRKVFELKRLLAKQPVERLGGGWLDNLTEI